MKIVKLNMFGLSSCLSVVGWLIMNGIQSLDILSGFWVASKLSENCISNFKCLLFNGILNQDKIVGHLNTKLVRFWDEASFLVFGF